jgi:anti-anti-sigma regulatory factor
MLRISVHDTPECVTFQLEGSLAGPWVRELEDCWHRTLGGKPTRAVRIDLSGVTFVDTAGKEFLAGKHGAAVVMVATNCWMKGVIAAITRPEG